MLHYALQLRKEGKYEESKDILVDLVANLPNDAHYQYQCAWSLDLLGEEAQAVNYYERAIELGLEREDLESAFVGLGSTYRTLGDYEKSRAVFERALAEFPNNKALVTFYAMTLYNLGEHNAAMNLLLTALVDTSNSKEIYHYKKAISFYSSRLDEVWK